MYAQSIQPMHTETSKLTQPPPVEEHMYSHG